MFVFHEIRPEDIGELEELADRLDTLNLPSERERLQRIIEKSRSSFGGEYDDLKDREYVFGLRDLEEERLVGASMIIAQHGTYERPAVYFQVLEQQKYSETIDAFFEHTVLNLKFDYHGPTEIGGLVLSPDHRGHRLKLGKLLSYVRFLYIGMHRKWFRQQIVAELLPPLQEDGQSDLWTCLGERFTGLHYREADRMSRQNVEFVRSLFPDSPIYATILPDRASEKIGVVGEESRAAAEMLRDVGFSYDERIDPFDGGPAYSVDVDDCPPVERTRWMTFAGPLEPGETAEGRALIGYEYDSHEVRFRAAYAEYRVVPKGVYLRTPALETMAMGHGDRFGFMPLSGPGVDPLHQPREPSTR
ncbi:MAG: arginine N-succinyltransferase [Bradymonadaceae bacterium]